MKTIFKKLVTLYFLLTTSLFAYGADYSTELYSQSVYLHRFKNPITQNRLNVVRSSQDSHIEPYAGIWWDHDRKTNGNEAYTDAQIAPYIGVRSKTWGPDFLTSRIFSEGRFVHRTKAFPDDRARSTYELRGGLIGYGLKDFMNPLFIENYYAFFYTRLYENRFIFQGWLRQGVRLKWDFDFFNEIFFDTFDQTRGRDATLDLRPGLRYQKRFASGSVQLLHQRLYHFSNLDFSGRNESRTTLVLGWYW